MAFNFENLAANLPDAYRKNEYSNNFKILEIERLACQNLREVLNNIAEALDIENATGKTLDLYGQRFGQARGKATDEQYIIMIKAKILRNLSNGTYKSIVDSIAYTFNCQPSEILIVENGNATVSLMAIPLETISKAGLTASQANRIVEALLPVSVTLSSFFYEGTFEFATIENETSATAGFANTEGDTTGGYFGITVGDEENIILPI